jgi:hypothetical protein
VHSATETVFGEMPTEYEDLPPPIAARSPHEQAVPSSSQLRGLIPPPERFRPADLTHMLYG